ncbi:MAG: hypothetical protein F4213_05700 [Boseongicola sp. SB0677_bin_26]|nr:hypothetical protein [Boseongicola sp. SB0665_bin_10]MYG25501.1 hypothetical protein [Boseongicola sp. SB0677_bin_26]
MTRMEVILKERHDRMLARLDGAASDLRHAAESCGAHIMFFGSFARRAVHDRSDLDVLILKESPAGSTKAFEERADRIGAKHDVFIDLRHEDKAEHLREGCVQ